MGPATVIGREGNNIWVSRRGTAIKVAARHLRHALPEEQIPWQNIEQELRTEPPDTDMAEETLDPQQQ